MLALWLALAFAAPSTGQVGPNSPHYDLELAYHEGRLEEGLRVAEARLAADPTDPNLHFIRFRFRFDLGETRFGRGGTHAERVAWYQEMLDTVEVGLAHNPDDPHLIFCRALGVGRLATIQGVLASLWTASSIERDLHTVVDSGLRYRSIAGEEDVPSHPLLALGIFYRLVPDWWIVQQIAGTRGNLDRSISYIRQAEASAPGQIQVGKELAVTLLCIGQTRDDPAALAEGLITLHEVSRRSSKISTDPVDLEHVQILLADSTRACDYSRDGYQDRRRSQLPQ